MVDVERLEVVTEPSELGETGITDGPVGQHLSQRGEETERTSAGSIGGKERRNHHIGTIWIDSRMLRSVGILGLHPGSIFGQKGTELLERSRTVPLKQNPIR